jgi:hypothetical protein
LDLADALVVANSHLPPPWPGIPLRWVQNKPRFSAHPPDWVSPELARLVATSRNLAHPISVNSR